MNGTGGEVATLGAGELLGQRVLPGTSDCTARSEVVLYRIDDGTLEELLAGHPELAAGLAAIAAIRSTISGGLAAPGFVAPPRNSFSYSSSSRLTRRPDPTRSRTANFPGGTLDGGSDARRAAEPAAGLVPRIQRLFRS